jgi:hypothetical protein
LLGLLVGGCHSSHYPGSAHPGADLRHLTSRRAETFPSATGLRLVHADHIRGVGLGGSAGKIGSPMACEQTAPRHIRSWGLSLLLR